MLRLAFSRRHRLGGARAYAQVLASRCVATGAIFKVYAKLNGVQRARLGLIVSKRIIPLAVARNAGKRLAREVFRLEQAALAGIDLVIRFRTAVNSQLVASARIELRTLLHQVRIQCSERARFA